MWAGSVVWRPRLSLRRWAATRWPRWKTSTVVAAGAHIDDLVDEGVGDGVVVAVDLDVVVDVDAGALPLAVDEGLGGQRPERGLVEALEELAAAGAVEAHGPGVEVGEQLGDAGVERGEGEEGLVAQAGEDPALDDLHRHLDLRLVARVRRPRGQDHRAVVLGELLVGALQAGLVAARDGDAALELVADHGAPVTPPKNSKARWWLAIQSGTCWVRVASA